MEGHTVRVMISQLKESLYHQREQTAEGLTSVVESHPRVVEALCTAALEDRPRRFVVMRKVGFMNVRSGQLLG